VFLCIWFCSFDLTRHKVSFSPPIFLDIQWPISNVELDGMSVNLVSLRISVEMRNQIGVLPFAASPARKAVTNFMTSVLRGTPFSRPGYSPFSDSQLMSNIAALQKNIVFPKQGFCFGGPPTAISVDSISEPGVSASLTALQTIKDVVELAEGTTVYVNVDFRGSVSSRELIFIMRLLFLFNENPKSYLDNLW
jgi:hypothetical protein